MGGRCRICSDPAARWRSTAGGRGGCYTGRSPRFMVVVLLAVGLQPPLLMVLRPAAAPSPPTSQTRQIKMAWPEQTVHLMAARRRGRRAGNGEGAEKG
ncbi:hypothetical protein ACQJBY_003158 [Aegilops geniculata]